MARIQLFKFKVRLEGIDVPFQGGSLVVRRGHPTRLTLNVAPTNEITKILPRTLVHLFYTDPIDKQPRMFFEGEVTGKGRTKRSNSRSFVIYAEGLTNYWFTAYLYMISPNSAQTFAPLLHARSVGVQRAYHAVQRGHDLTSLLEQDLVKSFQKILGRVPEINEFYQNAEERLKITSRIQALNDAQITELYTQRIAFDRILESLTDGQMSTQAPIMAFLQSVMELMYYEYVEIPSPSSLSSQFIFKPRPYFSPVPRCNVVFPDRYGQYSEQREFFAEPTRILLRTNAFVDSRVEPEDSIGSGFRMAPPELQSLVDGIDESVGQGASQEEIAEALEDLHSKTLTAEERVKGIIPDYINLGASEWAVTVGAGGEEPSRWLDNLVNYKFFLRKFQHRTATLEHSFDPWAVVGFPMGVVDSFGVPMGILDTAVHSFSTTSGSTQFTLGYLMNPEDEIPGDQAIPPLPVWFSEAYATGSAYSQLFGSPSVGGSAQDSADQIQGLFEDLKKAKDSLSYAIEVNRRPVAGEAELFSFLGASATSIKDLVVSGGPFRSDHQVPIKAHVNRLARRSALVGF